jgi:hypothetical protein
MKEPTFFIGAKCLAVTNDDRSLVAEVNAAMLQRWCGRVRPHHEIIAQKHGFL